MDNKCSDYSIHMKIILYNKSTSVLLFSNFTNKQDNKNNAKNQV